MYQVAICDDEPSICEIVACAVKAWNKDVKVTCFYSGEVLIEKYTSFDAIFLDIDMKENIIIENNIAEKVKM